MRHGGEGVELAEVGPVHCLAQPSYPFEIFPLNIGRRGAQKADRARRQARADAQASTLTTHSPTLDGEVAPRSAAFSPLIVTLSLMTATILQSLDSTIANVALPQMQGALSASQEQMGWVLTSYIVAAAIMIPLSGWLANAIGKRTILLASIVVFTLASVACGLATNLAEIVLFRFIQGVGGAALVPLSQAVLLDINEPRNYGRAMAIWAGAAQLGTICGPALGGWLTENLDWRWVFFINIPIGVLAFLGLLTFVDRPPGPRQRFDVMGFTTLSIALASLQLLLDRGQTLDWFASTEICIEALVAVICFYVFVVHMFTADNPFLKPGLFRNANFLASIVFVFLLGVVLFSTLALLPPMLQSEMDYPVVLTGLVIAPRGIGTLMGMVLVARMVARVDVRVILATGLILTALSLWSMGRFSPDMSYGPIVLSGFLQGVGVALVYVPASTTAMSTLSMDLRNEGAAMFNLMRNIGSSAGISVVFCLLARNTQTMHASLAELWRGPGGGAFGAAIASGDAAAPMGLEAWNNVITHQGAFVGYLDGFRLMMVMTIATLPFVLLLKPTRGIGGGAMAME
jgi:DHA2 family multidrug resistance protein